MYRPSLVQEYQQELHSSLNNSLYTQLSELQIMCQIQYSQISRKAHDLVPSLALPATNILTKLYFSTQTLEFLDDTTCEVVLFIIIIPALFFIPLLDEI